MNKISTNINSYVALRVSCPCAGHEGTCRIGCIAPIILNLSGQLHALAASPPQEKHPHYPLNRRLGGPTVSLNTFGEQIDICPLPEI
jgi:hypothetical protein